MKPQKATALLFNLPGAGCITATKSFGIEPKAFEGPRSCKAPSNASEEGSVWELLSFEARGTDSRSLRSLNHPHIMKMHEVYFEQVGLPIRTLWTEPEVMFSCKTFIDFEAHDCNKPTERVCQRRAWLQP